VVVPGLLAGDIISISCNSTDYILASKCTGEANIDKNEIVYTMPADGNFWFTLQKTDNSNWPSLYSIAVNREVEIVETLDWTFTGNAADADITTGDETITQLSTVCKNITAPSDCAGLYIQGTWKRYKNTTGLRNVDSGDRMLIVPNLKKDDVIRIFGNSDAVNNINTTKYTGIVDNDNNTLSFKMEADGNFYFKIVKAGGTVNSVQVWPSITRICVYREKEPEAPALTLDETAYNVQANAEVTFTASLTAGSPAPTLQWYSCDDAEKANAAAIDGATSATYSPSTANTGVYYFYVTATNSEGTATSDVITLTITGTVATPTIVLGSYNYEQGGYAVTATCATEGATLKYKIGEGEEQECTSGVPFYAKGGKIVVTATKEGWTSATLATSQQYVLNAAPSATSPETLISFQKTYDDGDKNIDHVYKSVTILGGTSGAIAGRDGNGRLKLRTNQNNSTMTLNVNDGYVVTGVSISANSNNSGATIGLSSVSVDGGANIMGSTTSFPVSGDAAVTYATGDIAASSSIVFTFDNSNIVDNDNTKKNRQIFATITVTYKTPTEVAIENAIADCKTYETSAEFATYIDGQSFASVAEVYAAHSAWQIEQAEANGSTDFSKAIMNAGFELGNINGWTIYGDASSAATDGDRYGLIEDNGAGGYQYYTGWNGRNVSQLIAGLPAGTYELKARIYSWGGGAPVRIFANGTLSAEENGENHEMSLEFTVTGEEEFIKIGVGGVGNNNNTDNTWGTWGYRIDYFTLTRTAVTATVSSANYATYCSPYALNFDGITGLTAYRAYKSGDVVKFDAVTEVPANEGLLLRGTGTYNVPIIESASAIENVFVGVLEETTIPYAAESDAIYVLKNGTSGVGFYKTTKAFTVRANSAYLPASIAAGVSSAREFIGFDDETNGISNVRLTDGETAAEVYDLQGRRISEPTKGLYIVNGKKVIIK